MNSVSRQRSVSVQEKNQGDVQDPAISSTVQNPIKPLPRSGFSLSYQVQEVPQSVRTPPSTL